MHCSDLGVLQYVAGSVVWELFIHYFKGVIKRPQRALADMMIMVKLAAKSLGMKKPPLNRITLSMVRATKGKTLSPASVRKPPRHGDL